MSETKAAFAERTKRSLKNKLYRYLEDYGYKYIHKMSQLVATLISRKNCWIDLNPKLSRKSTFCPFLFTASYYKKIKKTNIKFGD